MKTTTRALVFLIASFVAPLLHAATIYLQDGSSLQGTIVSATAADIQIHTSNGIRTIETNRISRIDYEQREGATRAMPYSQSPSVVFGNELQTFSLDLGFAAPLSDIDFSEIGGGSVNNGSGGIWLGTQYLYDVTPRWSAGLGVDFIGRGSNSSSSLIPSTESDVSGNSLAVLALSRFSPVRHGGARPYITVGIGTNRTSLRVNSKPSAGFVWSDTDTDEDRDLIDQAKWGLAYTGRLGIDFHPMAPTIFTFELGWTKFSNDSYSPTSAGKDLGLGSVDGDLDIFSILARWGWRF